MSATVAQTSAISVTRVKDNCEVRMLSALAAYFGAYHLISRALNMDYAKLFEVTVTSNSVRGLYLARNFVDIEILRNVSRSQKCALATWEHLFAHGPCEGLGFFAPGTEITLRTGLHFPSICDGNKFCLIPSHEALKMPALLTSALR
jgi:hypothetical protein